MKMRPFGQTGLQVSEVGFGAWAIGGPAMAGTVPIGCGHADDAVSRRAIQEAIDSGITFFDTADFYGLGHSEALIGEVVGNRPDVVVATKVGHRLAEDGSVLLDYSRGHIIEACDRSLERLRRDCIDVYQLHSARLPDLQAGDCVVAMEDLVKAGKIRHWGLSLNTYEPHAEASFMMDRGLGDGFQLVLNVINQRAVDVVERARQLGYGVIARMPLQFGLLAGKFGADSRFAEDDHRHFRLKTSVLTRALEDLEDYWVMASGYDVSVAGFALSFVLSFPGVSTVIPGIRTPGQARTNASEIVELQAADRDALRDMYEASLAALLDFMAAEEAKP